MTEADERSHRDGSCEAHAALVWMAEACEPKGFNQEAFLAQEALGKKAVPAGTFARLLWAQQEKRRQETEARQEIASRLKEIRLRRLTSLQRLVKSAM